jgi:hypothetical protein
MPDTESRLCYYLRHKQETPNVCLIVFAAYVVYYVCHVFGSINFGSLCEVLK